MEYGPSEEPNRMDDSDRLVWKENERGLHLSVEVLADIYSATGITAQSVLEVMVLELADTLEQQMESVPVQRTEDP